MKCIDPTLVSYDTQGKRIFRSFSIAKNNVAFLKNHHLVFKCGKCLQCRKAKAYELAMRCVLHASTYKENCFITLTYDEKKETYNNDFHYKEIQDFKKKYRNLFRAAYSDIQSRKTKYYYFKKVQIFNVHEYGKNGKKHWHLIVFNHNFEDRKKNPGSKYYNSEELLKLWPYGHHSIGDVSEASAMYQAQYMEKDFQHFNAGTKRKSHSKHSGIGRPFFEKNYEQLLTLGYLPFNGQEIPLPRYFEKLAHKHYSHYYEQQNFRDTNTRKALYRPFRKGQEKQHIAELYKTYIQLKEKKIIDLEKRFDDVISQYAETKQRPDFEKSGQNALYDLQNKSQKENF